MRSVWKEQADPPRFNSLRGDEKTEVLIIGGGLTGILCGYMLQEADVPYVIVEADRICSGITGSTTAKITSQHSLIYDQLIRLFGEEKARLYYEANQSAIRKYAEFSKSIDCDFEREDSYVYAVDQTEKLEREMRALQRIGASGVYMESVPLPVAVKGAVCFPNQAQFHPLKFASAIAKQLNIREHTRVLGYDGDRVVTNCGSIKSEKIITATHFPLFNKHGSYFLKLYQHRSYVLGLEGVPKIGGMYVDADMAGLSFRSHGSMLLLGGGAHRTGKQGGGWQVLENFAGRHYPQAEQKYRWAAQDCMSLDGVPCIGRYSARKSNLFVASGFNKWGMTSAMTAAMILKDLVQEKENPYAEAFSPSRTMLRKQLFVNGWESAVHLLTPGKPRCPHMGCKLVWNRQERSWDCPCHGSRFAEDGQLLDNPSTGDLNQN